MLDVFFAAFGSVLTLFLFVAAGFVIRKCGLVQDNCSAQVSQIIFTFFLPCLLIDLILHSIEFSDIAENSSLLVVGLAVIAAGIGVGWLLWLGLRRRGCPFAVPGFAMGFPNYGFMGIPIVEALYGRDASAALLLYTLPLYLLTNIAGYMIMSSQKKLDWKKVMNPCTIAILLGFGLKLLPFGLPAAISSVFSYGSAVVSPLAMLSVGLVIGGCSVGRLRENLDYLAISGVRLLAFPAALLGVLWLCGFRGYELAIPVIISAAPVAANMTILAGALGKHEIASARMVFVSTLLSLVTIPLIASLIPPVG